MFSFIFQVAHLNKAPTIPHSTVDHIQEEKKTGEELVAGVCYSSIYMYMYVHKTVKTKIIVPKTSFRLTENFLADAFAFL